MNATNETDNVYRDYFQREVPKTLPPLPLNRVASAAAPRSATNQYLMAASVAALLGLGLWLSGSPATVKPKGDAPGNLLNSAEADGKKILEAVKDPMTP